MSKILKTAAIATGLLVFALAPKFVNEATGKNGICMLKAASKKMHNSTSPVLKAAPEKGTRPSFLESGNAAPKSGAGGAGNKSLPDPLQVHMNLFWIEPKEIRGLQTEPGKPPKREGGLGNLDAGIQHITKPRPKISDAALEQQKWARRHFNRILDCMKA